MKILVIENDQSTAQALVDVLTAQHYAVEVAIDGRSGLALLDSFEYDFLILDTGLPDLSGIEICQQIRQSKLEPEKAKIPILLLTAHDNYYDRALGLDAGADDYLVKPFDEGDLLARLRAVLRRTGEVPMPLLGWRDLQLNPSACEIMYFSIPITLTPKEYSLLELFLRNSQRVFSCAGILEHLWAYGDVPSEEAVRTHIKGLRQKLRIAGAPDDLIETVYGTGYRLKPLTKETSLLSETTKSSEQELRSQLSDIWLGYRDKVSNQIATIEQVACQLDLTNQSLAAQQAHILAGLLATFGFTEGSQLSQEIEKILAKDFITLKALNKSCELAINLRQEIDVQLTDTNPEHSLASGRDAKLAQKISQQRAKILVVDDDIDLLEGLDALLKPWDLEICTLNDLNQFWQVLESFAPDVLVLNAELADGSAINLCRVARDDPRWHNLPLLVMMAHPTKESIAEVLAAGANDFINKPLVAVELGTRIQHCLERVRLLKQFLETDLLTGIANQQQSAQEIGAFLKSAAQYTSPIAIAVIEVDRLREINIKHGYAVGNTVLRRFSQLLEKSFGDEDVVARWSGKEFVVGMYGQTREQGVQRLIQFLELLSQETLHTAGTKSPSVTFSAGVAQYPIDGTDLQSLYQSAAITLKKGKSLREQTTKQYTYSSILPTTTIPAKTLPPKRVKPRPKRK